MKIRDLLTDESKWAKFCWARDKDGKECYPDSKNAVAWSIDGAVQKCYLPIQWPHINHTMSEYLEERPIQKWNDKYATFKDVKKLIEELDI